MKSIKINNVSKRIFSATLAFTLMATSLTGCRKDFRYERTNKNGKYVVEVTGNMDYKTAGDLKVIALEVHNENMLFLARKYEDDIRLKEYDSIRKRRYQYWDVFDDFKIIELFGEIDEELTDINYEDPNVKLLKEENLEYYLNEYGYSQKEYSIEELLSVFEQIKENYKFENNKTLVKK